LDITEIILDEHNKQRRLFGYIQEIDRADTEALSSVWKYLQRFLDVHAAAEERFFYPELLKQGSGAADASSAKDETKDAIKDHNEIRDSGKAVDEEQVGSDAWFKAIARCDLANSKHMSEEERQALADFRCSASLEERHRLGVKFLTYIAEHPGGVPPVDKDPKAYVEDPQKEMESAGADA
jgi:hypothetical protein